MNKYLIAGLAVALMASVSFAQDSGKAKQKSTQEYIADLSSKDEAAVVAAADKLGDDGEKQAVPSIALVIKNNSSAKARMHACVALGLIGDESGIHALNEALLNDSSADVRYAAILAISRIGSTKSIDALRAAREKETDPYIRDYIDKMEAKMKKK
ncbi:MAG TPA: HEAT repeat domain-containing protein [Spirochaetota bacterium]|nr:HEAT repeat domain-containing protein [Spirochaetota bacterium]